MAGGRRRLPRRPGHRRRRVPHGVPLPADARTVHGRTARVEDPRHEILGRTPPIPENCQWGIFLRNHDELTLEMVTDEERDYMWEEYARPPDEGEHRDPPAARAAAGQRSRPDQAVHRTSAVPAQARRSSTTGTRSGWETTSGSADRDGVRTPMQWTPDRNAGFSTRDPGRLYAPVVADPVYGYQVTNVEAQLRDDRFAAQLDPADDPRPQGPRGLRARRASPISGGPTPRCCPTPAPTGRTSCSA